jgi:hypothetical protein
MHLVLDLLHVTGYGNMIQILFTLASRIMSTHLFALQWTNSQRLIEVVKNLSSVLV